MSSIQLQHFLRLAVILQCFQYIEVTILSEHKSLFWQLFLSRMLQCDDSFAAQVKDRIIISDSSICMVYSCEFYYFDNYDITK